MKTIIKDEPMTFSLKVWLYDDSPEGRVIYNIDGSRREEIPPGAEAVEPSLTIHDQALSALVTAGSEIVPPSRIMQRHLDDAICTRDRLLSLVEQGVKGAAENPMVDSRVV